MNASDMFQVHFTKGGRASMIFAFWLKLMLQENLPKNKSIFSSTFLLEVFGYQIPSTFVGRIS